jgi:hypothetical protein
VPTAHLHNVLLLSLVHGQRSNYQFSTAIALNHVHLNVRRDQALISNLTVVSLILSNLIVTLPPQYKKVVSTLVKSKHTHEIPPPAIVT